MKNSKPPTILNTVWLSKFFHGHNRIKLMNEICEYDQ